VDNPEGVILNGTTTLAVQSLPSMSLETFGRASMKDKSVAILENHMRDHIASLVHKYGGTPFSAPALAEIPDVGDCCCMGGS